MYVTQVLGSKPKPGTQKQVKSLRTDQRIGWDVKRWPVGLCSLCITTLWVS